MVRGMQLNIHQVRSIRYKRGSNGSMTVWTNLEFDLEDGSTVTVCVFPANRETALVPINGEDS